jgi:hypothetical protein
MKAVSHQHSVKGIKNKDLTDSLSTLSSSTSLKSDGLKAPSRNREAAPKVWD